MKVYPVFSLRKKYQNTHSVSTHVMYVVDCGSETHSCGCGVLYNKRIIEFFFVYRYANMCLYTYMVLVFREVFD